MLKGPEGLQSTLESATLDISGASWLTDILSIYHSHNGGTDGGVPLLGGLPVAPAVTFPDSPRPGDAMPLRPALIPTPGSMAPPAGGTLGAPPAKRRRFGDTPPNDVSYEESAEEKRRREQLALRLATGPPTPSAAALQKKIKRAFR